MGLHTGEPLLADENYVGMDVQRAARIMVLDVVASRRRRQRKTFRSSR
jgi:class 3 adenylate cyclase